MLFPTILVLVAVLPDDLKASPRKPIESAVAECTQAITPPPHPMEDIAEGTRNARNQQYQAEVAACSALRHRLVDEEFARLLAEITALRTEMAQQREQVAKLLEEIDRRSQQEK